MAAAGEPIRINDLRNPVLTDEEREALEHAERHPVKLSEYSVLEAARHATGLTDFGPDDFRERLRSWLCVISECPNLTEFGRTMNFQRCVRFACTRLRLQDLVRRYPEIYDIQIQRPIIIVGPGRSGTTHLHGLLASDSRLSSISWREGADPISEADKTSTGDGANSVYERYTEIQQRQRLRHVRAMTPRDPNDAAEDLLLLSPDFPIGLWEFRELLSSGRFSEYDHTSHYQYMRMMLRALQWRRGTGSGRWVLKDPVHSLQLGPLLATFSDATIVIPHRDPVAVVQSIATMMAYTSRMRYRNVDTGAVMVATAERVESMQRSIIRAGKLLPEDQRVDVLFHEFMADEIGTAAGIYDVAGLEFAKGQRSRMETYLEKHRRNKYGRIIYDLRADFDTDPSKLRKRFSFYLEHFPVKVEVE